MTNQRSLSTILMRTCAAGTMIIGLSGVAFAGECPAEQVKPGAMTSGETAPSGVTDNVLGSIDLSPKGEAFQGMTLRLRKLVIEPGGVVPWHEHSQRPANIYVVSGTIEEYRSTCLVPVVHKPGDTVSEFGAGLAHWWKNTGKEPVVLISADLVTQDMPKSDMM